MIAETLKELIDDFEVINAN
nr:F420H2:quinone oxidoreductase complex, F420H2:2,3-dimethyl-1,4-naphthoquinone oxidoreductase=41 kda polypeptide {N-terminal} {EC 1.6.5.-} [Archaeoglobus fulgidus, VC-16, DSM 4304, Peptide Partial, 19 aa] [Archaeoglobus fulgidus]